MKEAVALVKQNFGIEISIPTVSGISPWIQSQGIFGKYCTLAFRNDKFEVSSNGMRLDTADAIAYAKDMTDLAGICDNLNALYKPLPLKG